MKRELRLLVCLGIAALILAGCGGPAPTPDGPVVQGLAADRAGLDAEGGPIAPEAESAASEPRRGLSGLFARSPDDAAPEVPLTTAEPSVAEVPTEPPAEVPRRGGLFGLFGGGRSDTPAAAEPAPFGAANASEASAAPPPEVPKGTILPFGQVATVCGLSPRDMGKTVDQHPRDGRALWQLHDTDPSSTGLRTQFISGFRDRCARRFTGALVLFGNPDVHETTRYASTNKRPYNQTDNAYEAVKSRICGVRPKAPCPADRYARLDKAVSFVTVYPKFGATDEWYELLLVDGQLEAAAMSGS